MALDRRAVVVFAACGLALAAPAFAQIAPPASREVPWRASSGKVGFESPEVTEARVVYSTVVTVPNASWLRLKFGEVKLAGVIEEGSGSFLRISSLRDGGTQFLNAESAAQWANTSAFFNGDTVLVELLAYSGTGENRLSITGITAGEPPAGGIDSICFGADDRLPSSDPRQARHSVGCTAWLWDDTNRMFGSAGHCGASAAHVMMFNVPLSTSGGQLVNPPPEHQYPVEAASVSLVNGGIGNDWAYFACFPNSNTGLTAYQAQGGHYTMAAAAPATPGPTIRITGYGTVSSPISPTWNQVQKTHTGPFTGMTGTTLNYQTDTTGGNSGSPVINESDGGKVIGVHTHAGCTSSGGANRGTAMQLTAWANARNAPKSLAKSGRGVVTGTLFAIGDGVNNFGTCNSTTGSFAKIDVAPPRMEGLAYATSIGKFYAVSNDTYGVIAGPSGRKLWTIDPATGAAEYIANISGATGVINGLGFDAASNVLYGVIQATGTRVVINTTTGAATVDGTDNAGTTIGAIEFNPADGLLYGINDAGGASKLVTFSPATGSVMTIGNLGAGIADCNGLAIDENGDFWTINAATEQLLKINPSTGAATVIGPTDGIFGASFGMSAVLPGGQCYANCDGSSASPILNVADFSCFLTRFAAADPYCNCDGSTEPPTLNVADFSCFLSEFAAGCP